MKRSCFSFAIVLLAAAAVHAQQIKVHYDKDVNFTRFKTYSWIEGQQSNNPIAHQEIVSSIDRELMKKGLRRVEENGDLNVAYYSSLGGNVNARMVDYTQGLDLTKWGGGDVSGTQVGAMPMARIILDLIDVSAKKLVWRGIARDTFTPNQGHAKHRINHDMERLLKKYPPKR